MTDVLFTYQTNLTISECIKRLRTPPLHFKINWIFSRDYEIENVSQNKLTIIFTKGYNLSNHKTKYQVSFREYEGNTFITFKFAGEQGGFPYPFVTDWEITKLLSTRIRAQKIDTRQGAVLCADEAEGSLD